MGDVVNDKNMPLLKLSILYQNLKPDSNADARYNGYTYPTPPLGQDMTQVQAIQFSISTQFSCIWHIDRTLSGATTPGQFLCGV